MNRGDKEVKEIVINVLREATIADIELIINIEENSFDQNICEDRATYEKRLNTFIEGFYILEVDDIGSGYICGELWHEKDIKKESFNLGHAIDKQHHLDGDSLYISSFGIHEHMRGKGLGSFCFDGFITNMQKKYPQIKTLILIVSVKWSKAISIYERNGFNEIDRVKDFFTEGEDGIIMKKYLKEGQL